MPSNSRATDARALRDELCTAYFMELARCACFAPRISCSPFLFRTQERVDTILPDCPGRLSWRHRARPSATLHEIQARSQGANLNIKCLAQSDVDRKWKLLRAGPANEGTRKCIRLVTLVEES